MPIVFVHGIGNRRGERYDRVEAVRDGLLRRFLMPAVFGGRTDVTILNPYWGEYGGKLRWRGASAEVGGAEAFGGLSGRAPDDVADAHVVVPDIDRPLLSTACLSLPDAVDLLYSATKPEHMDEPLLDLAGALVAYQLAAESASMPAAAEPERYPWLTQVRDDRAFLDRLLAEVAAPGAHGRREYFGSVGEAVRDRLAQALRSVRRNAISPMTGLAAGMVRSAVTGPLSVLIGDVLSYLAQRGTRQQPGPIVRVVWDALGSAAAVPGEPLVVVAHSMGGNIVYDLLTSFAPALRVDLLITVGSQVGLFEELKLFQASDIAVPSPDMLMVRSAPSIPRWLNIVDRSDPLAYSVAPIFDEAVDYVYPSGALWAHGAYFRQPRFHQRLAVRAKECLS